MWHLPKKIPSWVQIWLTVKSQVESPRLTLQRRFDSHGVDVGGGGALLYDLLVSQVIQIFLDHEFISSWGHFIPSGATFATVSQSWTLCCFPNYVGIVRYDSTIGDISQKFLHVKYILSWNVVPIGVPVPLLLYLFYSDVTSLQRAWITDCQQAVMIDFVEYPGRWFE